MRRSCRSSGTRGLARPPTVFGVPAEQHARATHRAGMARGLARSGAQGLFSALQPPLARAGRRDNTLRPVRVALIANRASGGGLDPAPLAAELRERGAEVAVHGCEPPDLEAVAAG